MTPWLLTLAISLISFFLGARFQRQRDAERLELLRDALLQARAESQQQQQAAQFLTARGRGLVRLKETTPRTSGGRRR